MMTAGNIERQIPDCRTMKEKLAMELKIAFLQILPGKNTDENLAIGKNACIEAKEKGGVQIIMDRLAPFFARYDRLSV